MEMAFQRGKRYPSSRPPHKVPAPAVWSPRNPSCSARRWSLWQSQCKPSAAFQGLRGYISDIAGVALACSVKSLPHTEMTSGGLLAFLSVNPLHAPPMQPCLHKGCAWHAPVPAGLVRSPASMNLLLVGKYKVLHIS